MSVILAVTIGALYAIGTYALFDRALSRIIIGLALLGHGSVLMLLFAGGPPGRPPFADSSESADAFADPLPQAMALTAIVITFGVLVFLLAVAYRSWTLTHDDEVEDDREDARLASDDRVTHRVERVLSALDQDPDER